MLDEHLRELNDPSEPCSPGQVPPRIVRCFEDLLEPVFHTLHLASCHTLFRHVPRGSHSRFPPCVWGVRRDDYRWEQPEGQCRLAGFLTVAAAMTEFVLEPPAGRWGGLLPGPRIEVLFGNRSRLYLPDFWVLTLHHLVWTKRLPYAIESRWAQGRSVHDESYYFVSDLPLDVVEVSRDALVLFQEAARTSTSDDADPADPADPADATVYEPPVYLDGRWRQPTHTERRIPDDAVTAVPKAPEANDGDGLELDEESFTVRFGGGVCRFRAREKQLFALLERISRRPGYRVSFDDLRSKDDVWDGSQVEDSTIRGAVTRLRKVLKDYGLGRLADRIATGTYQGRSYAVLDSTPSESA